MAVKGRRQFITRSIKIGATVQLLNIPVISAAYNIPPVSLTSTSPLNILILGGTSFLGPHQIAYALERGHSVTIFTRGRTKPTIHTELFKDVEHLIGDREDNLEALRGRKWDAVIDNSGRRARWTKDTAELLRDNVGTYLYTSSTGVYYPYLGSNIKEDTKLVLKVPDGINEIQSMEYGYGVMKTNSEIEAINAFGGDRTIIVRPTYMMGPGDGTDRFTYWPVRLEKGGEVMIPGKTDDPVQYIDARDVAEWMIRLIESESHGIFNAVGPSSFTGMHAFVYGVHAVFNSKADFVPIDDYKFLDKNNVHDVVPWIMAVGNNYGSARVNNQFSVNNGLTFRPLAQSSIDIFGWWNSDAVTEERRKKMVSGEGSLMSREKSIIEAWKAEN